MGSLLLACLLVLLARGFADSSYNASLDDAHSREERSLYRRRSGPLPNYMLDINPRYGVDRFPNNNGRIPSEVDTFSLVWQPFTYSLPGPARVDQDLVVLFLRVSTVLRNNLVNTLGFILFQPKSSLDVDTYGSLMDIFKGLQTHRVHTYGLVPLVPTMAYKNPHDQMMDILQVLRRTKPLYLTGAVDVWIDRLQRHAIDLNALLQPQGRTLAVDLLAGVDAAMFQYINTPITFTPRAMQLAPKHVVRTMGVFMGSVFGALIEGSLQPTRQIVAHVMMNTILYMFIPEVDEAKRYLADVMLSPGGEALDFAVDALDAVSRGDPHLLVRTVLTRIATSESADPVLKECAEVVLPHFQPMNMLSVNPYFGTMMPIYGRRDIDLELLFSSVSAAEYPEDIVKAKDLLVVAIYNNEVNLDATLRGFVKYEYARPQELLLGLLERIRRRGRVPEYLKQPLRALTVHVQLKYYSIKLIPWPMASITDFYNVLEAFYTPHMPASTKSMIQKLANAMENITDVDWKSVIDKVNLREYARPRQFVRQVLVVLLSAKLISDKELVEDVKRFIAATDKNGDSKECPAVTCEGNQVKEVSITPLPQVPSTPAPATPPPSPSKKNISDVDYPQLFNAIGVTAVDVPDILKLENYISGTITKYLIEIDVDKYPTTGEFLRALFAVYMARAEVKRDNQIYSLFLKYSVRIQVSGMGARPVTFITKTIVRRIDMDKVLLALDEVAIHKQGRDGDLEALFAFLAGDYQLVNYLERFQHESYKTRGDFLEGLFEHLVKFPGNPSADIKQTIRSLVPFIMKDGPGKEPIHFSETVHTEVETSEI